MLLWLLPSFKYCCCHCCYDHCHCPCSSTVVRSRQGNPLAKTFYNLQLCCMILVLRERDKESLCVCVCVCVLVCVCVCFRWVLYAFMLNLHPSLQARQNDHNASYNNYMHHLNNSLSLSICLSISPISHLLSLICGCAPVSLTVKYFFYPFACVFVTFFLNFLWTIMYATISL